MGMFGTKSGSNMVARVLYRHLVNNLAPIVGEVVVRQKSLAQAHYLAEIYVEAGGEGSHEPIRERRISIKQPR